MFQSPDRLLISTLPWTVAALTCAPGKIAALSKIWNQSVNRTLFVARLSFKLRGTHLPYRRWKLRNKTRKQWLSPLMKVNQCNNSDKVMKQRWLRYDEYHQNEPKNWKDRKDCVERNNSCWYRICPSIFFYLIKVVLETQQVQERNLDIFVLIDTLQRLLGDPKALPGQIGYKIIVASSRHSIP